MNDRTTYQKHFTTLKKNEKRDFLLLILKKSASKSTTIDRLFSSIKKTHNIPEKLLNAIFEHLLDLIHIISSAKKQTAMHALEKIHDKIISISKKEQQEKNEENPDEILSNLS